MQKSGNHKAVWCLCTLYIVTLLALTYILQTYQLTYREEADVFLYDIDYITSLMSRPGGVALILGSWCSQFFIFRLAGPLIVSAIYGIVIICLVKAGEARGHMRLSITALAPLPCMMLMLCLENITFRTYGIIAMALCVAALPIYARISIARWQIRIATGMLICVAIYWIAGSAALMTSVSFMVIDCLLRRKLSILSLLYPAITAAVAYISYCTGRVYTLSMALTPDMYYEMGSTYYMMMYALCAVPLYLVVAYTTASFKAKGSLCKHVVVAVALLAAETAVTVNLYGAVHSRSNYETFQQRYYARHGQWDAIAEMPYTGQETPYTSYRFLALAHKGELADNIRQYRPLISYLIENKPKVKRLDQQVYSDIYYACDYMSAARKSAFDTDIVTPGPLNPYETQKLAEINIVYGDYAVADKLLKQLQKTLFYSSDAERMRRYLYDDAAVEADPVLGPKRRAIPRQNYYMSPKGMQRDLKYIIDANEGQTVAKEFYRAFKILTNQNEDI